MTIGKDIRELTEKEIDLVAGGFLGFISDMFVPHRVLDGISSDAVQDLRDIFRKPK